MTFGLGKIEYSELFDALLQSRGRIAKRWSVGELVKLPSDAILGNSVNFETILAADSLSLVYQAI